MELLANLGLGLATALTLVNLLYCLIGVFLGTLIGVLPGLGPTATIAMLLRSSLALPSISLSWC
jgi:TctA family transporter